LFRLIIFDCDGVLVDSEPITQRVFARMLQELGLSLRPEEMFEHFTGRSMSHCSEVIARMLQRPLPADFLEQYAERTTAVLHAELRAVPEIEMALDCIEAAGVQYCVASSGSHAKMRTTLTITGLLPRFDGKLFSATDVPRGKPAPDVFLHAAARLGVPPAECCVIEDTPAGVAAAVAAGMEVLGYCAATAEHRLVEAGADRVFKSMSALPGLLFGPRSR
jgi:HAD superfamily hydrolase (TIGR01509 family)